MSVTLTKTPTGRTWRELIGDTSTSYPTSDNGILYYVSDRELPEIGGTAWLSSFDREPVGVSYYRNVGYVSHDNVVPYVIVPRTLWGDYIGGDVERSNARSLVRDFPDSFITVSGDYSSEMLIVPADATPSEYLAGEVMGLFEYPLYDEEDHTMLASEMVTEEWGSWLARETRNRVLDGTGFDLLDVDIDDEDIMSEDEMLAALWEFYSNHNEPPYAESAISCVYPNMDECVTFIIGKFHDAVLQAFGWGAGTGLQAETLDVQV